MSTCHICCRPLASGAELYHAKCSAKLFGSRSIPTLPYSWDDLNQLAEHIVRRGVTVPGVQPKLSLHLERSGGAGGGRLTLVGLEGELILKPPTRAYPGMPEFEHYTMQLAGAAGLDVAPCGLIPLAGRELAYITRRMDRTKGRPLHMEDLCQLTDKLTEQKYRGSMEQVGKAIRRYASNPGFDALRLFELTLYCFLTGNADMHLKNFSLLYEADGIIRLSPAYDLLPTKLLMPQDPEEMALTLNGRKSRLRRGDFEAFAQSLTLTDRQITNTHNRLQRNLAKARNAVPKSFLGAEQQRAFNELLDERMNRIWG
ncbi:MAG: HipA domain-containing protein [Candidatus Marinimicrobia bacterium]|nr:HipA domain-containing protein [Candidatus Neomarinimicrobiota bacterium]